MDNLWNIPMLKAQFESKFFDRKMILLILLEMTLIGLAFVYLMKNPQDETEPSYFTDLMTLILNNPYIQLAFFIPFFLMFLYEVCEEWSGKENMIVRFASRQHWIFHMIVIFFSFATLYAFIFLGVLAAFCYVLLGGPVIWGPVLFLLVFRYWFSVLTIAFVYLLTYRFVPRNKPVVAILTSMIVILINHLLHFSFLQHWVPWLSFNVTYVRGFEKESIGWTDIFWAQASSMSFVALAMIVLWATIHKMQFTE